MPKVAILLADGFETVEALVVADVLRRAGIRTRLVSIMGTTHVITGQQIQVTADETLDDFDIDGTDCFVLPGGMPGVKRLRADRRVCAILADALADTTKTVAAICAAPTILAELGLLDGRHVTVFPGCADSIPSQNLSDASVVIDGNLITGRSMSCALRFALAIVQHIGGPEAIRKVLPGIGVANDSFDGKDRA